MEEREDGRVLEGIEEWEAVVEIYCMREKSIFFSYFFVLSRKGFPVALEPVLELYLVCSIALFIFVFFLDV